tara:strand:- start:4497 stop:4748 length:252 start_codon:yes stop_codon:yes gene_type:complete
MQNSYKMLEATNREEAIVSILDVLKENPLFLNKCTGQLCILLQNMNEERRESTLNECNFETLRDLFIEIKTQYYIAKDNFFKI